MIRKLKLMLASFMLTGLVCAGALSPVSAQFDLFPDKACRQATNAEVNNEKPTICEEGNTIQSEDDNRIYGPNGIVTTIVNLLSIIIGFAAIVVIIVAGIQYMLSTGDPSKVNNAKNAILYALVGLAVAVIARAVVVFIINKI